MQKVNNFFPPIMTTPLERIAEEKNGNYQSSLKLVKDQYISVFFLGYFPGGMVIIGRRKKIIHFLHDSEPIDHF